MSIELDSAYLILYNYISLEINIGVLVTKNMEGEKRVKGFQLFKIYCKYVYEFHVSRIFFLPNMTYNTFQIP